MKLYYSPAACSLSPHIALAESGLPYTLEKVDLKSHRAQHEGDFYAINPKGYVPALALDSGVLLTEGPAIVQYIADQAPAAKLAPANGTIERYQLQSWLNFISTELHKQFSPLFKDGSSDEIKAAQRAVIGQRLDYVAKQLGTKDYLMGEFSVADGYLFTVMNWGQWVAIDIAQWPTLAAFMARVAARPAVQKALQEEHLRH
ncbi:MAG: glutathione transferase GstA [Burkholderiaceae bacterium]